MAQTSYRFEGVETEYLGNNLWQEFKLKRFNEPTTHLVPQYLYSLGGDYFWDDPSTRMRSSYYGEDNAPLWEVDFGPLTEGDLTAGNVLTLIDNDGELQAVFRPVGGGDNGGGSSFSFGTGTATIYYYNEDSGEYELGEGQPIPYAWTTAQADDEVNNGIVTSIYIDTTEVFIANTRRYRLVLDQLFINHPVTNIPHTAIISTNTFDVEDSTAVNRGSAYMSTEVFVEEGEEDEEDVQYSMVQLVMTDFDVTGELDTPFVQSFKVDLVTWPGMPQEEPVLQMM